MSTSIAMGNVLGRLGSGPRVLAFDAHIDTVGISNPTRWRHDPFRGIVTGGTLFGRGASDQKGGLAAVVHGVALADQVGLANDITAWVTATVNGEDCVGLAWQYLLNETDLRPEVVVIAMPSHLGICYGQRGRMEVEIDTTGVSAHGSQPERGRNAIYEMMPIIDGLKELHEGLEIDHAMLGRGSLAVTGISSQSPSLTAVPDGCTIHVDRRLTIGETAEDAQAQLEQVAEVAERTRVFVFSTTICLLAWLYLSHRQGFSRMGDSAGESCHSVGVERGRVRSRTQAAYPPIGLFFQRLRDGGDVQHPDHRFGPADELHSHTVNDQIPLAQLQPAMAFYGMYPTVFLQNS